jgi:hypothetical protein
MKWGEHLRPTEDEIPPELRDKSPTQVAELLRKAKEQEAAAAKAEEARVAAEAGATTVQQELDAMKAKVAELEARQTPPLEKTPPEKPSVWENPEGFVDDRIKGVANVALQTGMMTAKMYFMQGLMPRDQKIFRKYEKEVEQVVNTFDATARVMPQAWQNGFLYAKGLHESEIAKAESTQSDFFSETPSRGTSSDPDPVDKLTDEENAMCDAMHWSKDGYLKRKKEMTMATSSKGSYARFTAPTTTNR